MKRTIALMLALLLLCPFSVVVFADEAPAVSLESRSCEPYSPYLLLEGTLLSELPDWLWTCIFNGYGNVTAAPAPPIEAAPGPDHYAAVPGAFVPDDYTPYSVTNTKTYYDKNGAAAYRLILQAVFIRTYTGTVCLKTKTDYEILSGSWRIVPGTAEVNGSKVTAAFQVTQLFTGVPVKTDTVTLSLSAADRTAYGYLPGDLTGDGKITTADAHAAMRIAVKLDLQTDLALRIGDVTGDGEITTADARLILRTAIGLLP